MFVFFIILSQDFIAEEKKFFSIKILFFLYHFRKYILFYSFQPQEKAKYDTLFNSLQPVNGLASGDKVKPVSVFSFFEKYSDNILKTTYIYIYIYLVLFI